MDKMIKIHHVAGLGFGEGADVSIYEENGHLIFEAMVQGDAELPGGIKIKKLLPERRSVPVTEIKAVDILDESGRSLGKTALWGTVGTLTLGPIGLVGGALLGGRKRFRSFVALQIQAEGKPSYQVILGGEKQKEVRQKYDQIMQMIQSSG
jgi:hypothetical protein